MRERMGQLFEAYTDFLLISGAATAHLGGGAQLPFSNI